MECTESLYNDCLRIDFECNGHPSLIVLPDKAADGHPWVWRAEFFGAFDAVDTALLKLGWHICYHRVSDQYGAPAAIKSMKVFHDEVISRWALSSDAVLFGFSRGGLYAFNYACAYPDDVRALYLDAPVLDIRSWPGSKYAAAPADPQLWAQCLECYGITEAEVEAFTGNPLDHAAEPARNGIPLLIVAGACDKDVPYFENGAIMKALYAQAGGDVHTIVKPGCAHHPHGLADPAPIVDWILNHFRSESAQLENKEWTNTWWDDAPYNDLPRALMVGDSIANSYRSTVNDALGSRMRADTYATSKALDNPFFMQELALFIRQSRRPYSIIHFNNGLHGWHMTLNEYEHHYEEAIDALIELCPQAQIVLAMSTPVWRTNDPTALDPKRNGIVIARNEVVRRIAAGRGLKVDNLYSQFESASQYRQNDGFHYNQAGAIELGLVIAESVIELM